MGLRVRGAIRCGRCGKPRGITHTCVARSGAQTRRHAVQSPVTWECGTCGKPRGLAHTCAPKSDFKARRRKQAAAEKRHKRKAAAARRAARRRQAAAERRAREKARKPAARSRPSRPRGDSHEPGTCGDQDCPRFGCKAYWAGMADCPGPHGSEGG
ncbi:MAG: hypothetical protein ACLPKE_31855 [Streptosporangiaceae bacterium]